MPDYSHLTSSTAALLDAIADSVTGGSYSPLTVSRTQLLAIIANDIDGTSLSHLTTSEEALWRAVVVALDGEGFSYNRNAVNLNEFLADVASDIEGGGEGGAPAWVPDNAVIHIDLVGGDPQGRAWVEGVGEVAVDTLLGDDNNTNSWFGPSEYNAGDLTASGYDPTSPTEGVVAFIGDARTQILTGATVVVSFAAASGSLAFGVNAADGMAGVHAQLIAGDLQTETASGIVAGPAVAEGQAEGDNKLAVTLTPTKIAANVNGSATILSTVLDTDDWPTSGDSQIVAAFLVPGAGEQIISSIAIYAPVDNTELPALSALS